MGQGGEGGGTRENGERWRDGEAGGAAGGGNSSVIVVRERNEGGRIQKSMSLVSTPPPNFEGPCPWFVV